MDVNFEHTLDPEMVVDARVAKHESFESRSQKRVFTRIAEGSLNVAVWAVQTFGFFFFPCTTEQFKGHLFYEVQAAFIGW